ncbi:MAG: EAL domain-containing protein [Clostridia bacterium]|nr:EAL domain-containing protein [Clostridia bacterium]
MKNICFDLCAIPLYILILFTCRIRGMTRGRANRLFLMVNGMSLACAILDIWMEFTVNPLPLSRGAVALGTAISFAYKFLRNASIVIYFIYIFTATRTEYRLQPLKNRLFLWLPDGVLVVLLLQNFFTHNVYVITAEGGYARGPLLWLVYAIAFLYVVVGIAYCLYCKRYLIASKWIALISVYALTLVSVLMQMLNQQLMVELFASAIGVLMVLLLIMRPEETIDGTVVVQGWKAYQRMLDYILKGNQHVQIVVVKMMNAEEIRSYIGDKAFHDYVMEVAAEIDKLYYELHTHIDLYFERPGSFYLIIEDAKLDVKSLVPSFVERTTRRVRRFAEQGVHFEPKFCIIRCPEDLKEYQEILNVGHLFTRLGDPNQTVYDAAELVHLRDYDVINHMQEILNSAITGKTLEMFYQPIYDIHAGRFRSAEALARIRDPQYGMVSPALFIPEAEKTGLIIPLGNLILESVYRFISKADMEALGLSYVEINLSVAQCLQQDLPATVARLQARYGIKPSQVNFEITETMFDNLSEVMDRNLRELVRMGYSFSLDDYGIGYSNIHRLSKLPLEIIKIDKSLVDEMFTEDGQVIIRNTVRMMQDIHKELVVEGVETRDEMEALAAMSCDFIQGYYYSKPLPPDDFVRFLQARNRAA